METSTWLLNLLVSTSVLLVIFIAVTSTMQDIAANDEDRYAYATLGNRIVYAIKVFLLSITLLICTVVF